MRTLRIATALVFALAVHGQTSRGTVTGTVLDQSGAVIRGAGVRLAGVDTGAKLSTMSNDSGVYRFDAVDLGVYELEVAHAGFRPSRPPLSWDHGRAAHARRVALPARPPRATGSKRCKDHRGAFAKPIPG